jgi:hypothetical protein
VRKDETSYHPQKVKSGHIIYTSHVMETGDIKQEWGYVKKVMLPTHTHVGQYVFWILWTCCELYTVDEEYSKVKFPRS